MYQEWATGSHESQPPLQENWWSKHRDTVSSCPQSCGHDALNRSGRWRQVLIAQELQWQIHQVTLQQMTYQPMHLVIHNNLYIASRHSATEHRGSTRILHLTLFLASVLISAQVFLTPFASSSTFLCHVFLSLPPPCLLWGFHSRACLIMSLDGFCRVWPSHPRLRFLLCKCILGYFMRFHSSIFVIWCA